MGEKLTCINDPTRAITNPSYPRSSSGWRAFFAFFLVESLNSKRSFFFFLQTLVVFYFIYFTSPLYYGRIMRFKCCAASLILLLGAREWWNTRDAFFSFLHARSFFGCDVWTRARSRTSTFFLLLSGRNVHNNDWGLFNRKLFYVSRKFFSLSCVHLNNLMVNSRSLWDGFQWCVFA